MSNRGTELAASKHIPSQELSTEQRLKLSSTVIDAVIKGAGKGLWHPHAPPTPPMEMMDMSCIFDVWRGHLMEMSYILDVLCVAPMEMSRIFGRGGSIPTL